MCFTPSNGTAPETEAERQRLKDMLAARREEEATDRRMADLLAAPDRPKPLPPRAPR